MNPDASAPAPKLLDWMRLHLQQRQFPAKHIDGCLNQVFNVLLSL